MPSDKIAMCDGGEPNISKRTRSIASWLKDILTDCDWMVVAEVPTDSEEIMLDCYDQLGEQVEIRVYGGEDAIGA